jgi:hypothetical protein
MRSLFLFLACWLSQFVFAEPVPFHAEYVAEYRGLPVKAKGIRKLVALDDHTYQLHSSAKSLLANVTEVTEFRYDDGQVKPLRYQYARTGLGKNKAESGEFDWTKNILEHNGTTSALQYGTLDKLSYQFKLRADIARAIEDDSNETVFEYLVADEEKRKHYRFQLVGEETLATPVGELRTIRVDRIREDSDRQTSLWLSVEHDYLLVKLKQVEEDKGFELNLSAIKS